MMTARRRMLASIACSATADSILPHGEDRMLSFDETLEIVNLSKVTVWKKIQAGDFPHARELGNPGAKNRKCGFLLSEILAWMKHRPLAILKADKIAAAEKASTTEKVAAAAWGKRRNRSA